MNVAFKGPRPSARPRRCARRGAVAADRASTASMRAPPRSRRSSTASPRLISRQREPGTEVLRFPPVMSRRHLEKSGYLHSFPHLLGCVCCLHGGEARDQGRRRALRGRRRLDGRSLAPPISCSRPAACYPVYPLVAAAATCRRGALLRRRQRLLPPRAVARCRSPAVVPHARICLHRHAGAGRRVPRALDDARAGPRRRARPAVPHRARQRSVLRPRGKLMAMSQIEQALKFELLVPVRSAEQPTACMSFNYHRDHFGATWDLRTKPGEVDAYRLRRLRHGPPGAGAVRHPRPRLAHGRNRCATR